MIERNVLITKKYILAHQKSIVLSKFFRQKLRRKNFLIVGKWKWLKKQNMTERDALITKKHILDIKISIFMIEIFSCEIEVKTISLKLANRIGKKCRIWRTAMRWSPKTTFWPIKKSIFKIEIFSSQIDMIKFLENWK